MRVVIQIEKKILFTQPEGVLHPYFGAEGDGLRRWVRGKFQVEVLDVEMFPEHNVALVTGVLQGPKERMELFTLSQAIQSLKGREEGVARFLDRRREIFGVQLRYGLREGKILSIGEMTPQERGLRCGCVCPSCGKPLLAKMGKKVRWHFAHSGTENQCNPSLAGQTAVHMLAKEILQEAKKIYLPGIEVSWRETSYSDELWEISDHLPEKSVYKQGKMCACEDVILEKRMSSIVPDLVLTIQGKQCLVEIAVTHFVDEEKWEKISALGLPLLEIDLSEFYDEELDREKLQEAVIFRKDNRVWRYNPRKEEALQWAEKVYSPALSKARKAERAKQRRKAEQARKRKLQREAWKWRIAQRKRIEVQPNPEIESWEIDQNERQYDYSAEKEKWAAIEEERDREQASYYENVDFDQDEIIRDASGFRWLQCLVCGKKKREDRMASYGGPGRACKGICSDCSRKGL